MPSVSAPNIEQEKAIIQKLTDLLDTYTVSPDGNGIVADRIPLQEVLLLALKTQMQQLVSREVEPLMLALLESATISLAKQPKAEWTVENLVTKLNERLNYQGFETIKVIAFLNIANADAPTEIEAKGFTLTKTTRASYEPYLKVDEIAVSLETIYDDPATILAKFTAYQYEVTIAKFKFENGLLFAIEEIVAPCEQIRALLNFSHSIAIYSIFNLSVLSHSASEVIPSPVYFLEVNGILYSKAILEQRTIHARFSSAQLAEGTWERYLTYQQILDKNPRPSNSLNDFVWELLIIYQKGLDTIDDAVAFLHYWQILERITSPQQHGRGIETDKLVSRLSTLVELDSTGKQVLNQLGGYRHEFAHAGAYPFESGRYYQRVLKLFSDLYLRFLITTGVPNLATKLELEEYFNVATHPNNARLDTIEKALNILRQNKTLGTP